jgi:hypothetical protein
LPESTVILSCTPSLKVVLDKVVWESFGMSSGGRVGHQLGRLGPLSGGGSSGRPNPLVGDICEPGRSGPRGTHVSQAPRDV